MNKINFRSAPARIALGILSLAMGIGVPALFARERPNWDSFYDTSRLSRSPGRIETVVPVDRTSDGTIDGLTIKPLNGIIGRYELFDNDQDGTLDGAMVYYDDGEIYRDYSKSLPKSQFEHEQTVYEQAQQRTNPESIWDKIQSTF